jgi:hypothetical protein
MALAVPLPRSRCTSPEMLRLLLPDYLVQLGSHLTVPPVDFVVSASFYVVCGIITRVSALRFLLKVSLLNSEKHAETDGDRYEFGKFRRDVRELLSCPSGRSSSFPVRAFGDLSCFPTRAFGPAKGVYASRRRARSHTSFERFFALWKDGARDIPILGQAEREYEGTEIIVSPSWERISK